MGKFSILSLATEDEFSERYRTLNIMGKKMKDFLLPRMPGYIAGTITDFGVEGFNVSGCRICMPPYKCDKDGIRKILRKARTFGGDILVLEPEVSKISLEKASNMIVSKGTFYTPYTFINAVKSVASLMGIDFMRSNIVIADAYTEGGIIITELLLNEVLYLTLCTVNRDKLLMKLTEYIRKSGLSPAVAGNYKKAMVNCDILIYAGGADIRELISYSNRKILIANLTGEGIRVDKDVLAIDDVLLKGSNKSAINGEEDMRYFTSRVWEGALLTKVDGIPKHPDFKFSTQLGKMAEKLGIGMKAVISKGKTLDREDIYKYR
ncbi:hypothetical protein OXPF_34790 [Oxobacter pfennigii]|uniref:Uncharacterized protein n=1 Tax=Oxobacter pfennigii TaxID=36849 RepID=A0A0P8WWR2_9CLOT|nr:hypothetical protein [Oxobacter pfennigii]KPU42719.1 hypothetical protein OXPF_34790 [Oxobacter pfennigii]